VVSLTLRPNYPTTATVWETGWAPEQLWTPWKKETFEARRVQNADNPVVQLVSVSYSLFSLSYPSCQLSNNVTSRWQVVVTGSLSTSKHVCLPLMKPYPWDSLLIVSDFYRKRRRCRNEKEEQDIREVLPFDCIDFHLPQHPPLHPSPSWYTIRQRMSQRHRMCCKAILTHYRQTCMALRQVVTRGPLIAEGRVQYQTTTCETINAGVIIAHHVILRPVKCDLIF
jgi:hypothetical protein